MTDTNKIHIFEAGSHKAMSGRTVSMTAGDLQKIATAYNAGTWRAPITLGHAKDNSQPAYGWAQSLSAEGNSLYADVDFCEEIKEPIKAGHYKNVSASFYLPGNQHNPAGNVYGLRHVALLGATPPVVKSLEPLQFSEGETIADYVVFGEAEQNSALRYVGDVFRKIREMIIEDKGIEAADKVVPGWMADDIKDLANRNNGDSSNFSEPSDNSADAEQPTISEETNMTDKNETPNPEDLAARSSELDKREAQLKAMEQDGLKNGNAEFCEGLVKSGKLLPKDKDQVLNVLNAVSGVEAVDFSEGENAASTFKSFLESLDVKVDFSEKTEDADAPKSTQKSQDSTADFAEEAEAIVQYMDEQATKGRKISTAQAQKELRAKSKDKRG